MQLRAGVSVFEAGGSGGVAADENLGWDWLRDSAGEETVLFAVFRFAIILARQARDKRRRESTQNKVPNVRKTRLFGSFPYVCPEPVLVKCSFIYIKTRTAASHQMEVLVDREGKRGGVL
jgi:hypothetical protein